MKTVSISPVNFSAKAFILAEANANRKYLYNEVLELSRQEKFPATFTKEGIDLPSVSDKILEILKNSNIIFKQK